MHYVYLLRSESDAAQTYIGLSSDLPARLKKHNSGACRHTCKHVPWKLVTYIAFSTREQASGFESYLKSGSDYVFS